MAESADALDSGSSDRKVMEVQVFSGAPEKCNKKDAQRKSLDLSRLFVHSRGKNQQGENVDEKRHFYL